MAHKQTNLIVINGYPLPAPDAGFQIIGSRFVDGARNANGAVVGQLVGRKIWKIDGLKWSYLAVDEWARIIEALEPFYVQVSFTDYSNERHTLTMYPSDTNGRPLRASGLSYTKLKECGFNLIDCGL